MGEAIIKVDSVFKSYSLRERGYRSFREDLTRFFKRFSLRSPKDPITNNILSSSDNNTFWALKDISFEVKKGDALGIIGANGSGKTTILRLLSKVTAPTKGKIFVNGKVAPLIQVGAGFHPELTGRENVYLNSVIMGMSKNEVDEKYDDIVSFAGLEGFMDTPVKRYSSGMYVRLGFAVIANINPDIFLIDEILSVGDLSFQRKCLNTMAKIRESDKSIVFVSHNLSAIKGLCDRAIWLDKGEIKREGNVDDVINAYVSYMTSKSQFINDISYIGGRTRWGTGEVRFMDVRIKDKEKKEKKRFRVGEFICIETTYESYQVIESPVFWIGILNEGESWVTGFVLSDDNVDKQIRLQGSGNIKCIFKSEHLYPGFYFIVIGVFDKFRNIAFDRIGKAAEFELIGDRDICQDYIEPIWKGVINLPHEWEYKFST